MSQITWMLVQGTIFAVPLYWFVTDPSVRTDPKMLVGVIIVCWLVAATLTEGLTRLWDWCRFGPLKLAIRKVRQSKSQGSSPVAPSGRIGKLP